LRSQHRTLSCFLFKPYRIVHRRRHIANAGYAVRQQARQEFPAALVAESVNVHVPETGNQKLSVGIDDDGTIRNGNTLRPTHGYYAISANDNRRFIGGNVACPVYDGDMCKGKRSLLGLKENRRKAGSDQTHHESNGSNVLELHSGGSV